MPAGATSGPPAAEGSRLGSYGPLATDLGRQVDVRGVALDQPGHRSQVPQCCHKL
jgi:hypothetical protein